MKRVVAVVLFVLILCLPMHACDLPEYEEYSYELLKSTVLDAIDTRSTKVLLPVKSQKNFDSVLRKDSRILSKEYFPAMALRSLYCHASPDLYGQIITIQLSFNNDEIIEI